MTGRFSRLTAHFVPSAAQLTDAMVEASGLKTETTVVAAAAGASATPVMPRPRFSPATPANVSRAPSPGFAIATSAAAPSAVIATPPTSAILKVLCAAAVGATTRVCVPATEKAGNCVVVPRPAAFPRRNVEPLGSAIV